MTARAQDQPRVPPNADPDLVRRMAEGDASGLSELYDRHARGLFSLAFRILQDQAEAEEVVQDVFAQAWRQASRYDASRGPVVAWLLVMARSRSIDRVRAKAGRPPLQEDDSALLRDLGDGGIAADTLVVTAEQFPRLRGALQRLPLMQRTAIELAVYEGLSHAQIAERFEQPPGSVKTPIRLGLLKLRDAMMETPSDDRCVDGMPDASALGAVAAGLWQAVPQVDPPASLKARAMAVTGEQTTHAVSVPRETGQPALTRTRVRSALPSWLPMAAAALVALGLLAYAVQLRGRLDALESQLTEATIRLSATEADMREARTGLVRAQAESSVLAAPDLTRVDLTGQPGAPDAVARVFWSRAHGLVLTATRLPDLPRDRTYQVWVLTDGAPVSAGLMMPDAEGRVTAVFDTSVALPQPKGMAVSIEPAGGVPAPTGDVVLRGTLAG